YPDAQRRWRGSTMNTFFRAITVCLALSIASSRGFGDDNRVPLDEPDQIAQRLSDKDPKVRRQALVPFARPGTVDPKYRPVLRQAFKDDDTQVRLLAAMGLAASGLADKPFVDELVAMLDTEDGRRCGGAALVLANMKASAKDAVPGLIRAMKKYKDSNLTFALGRLAPYAKEQALPALKEALDDRNMAIVAALELHNLKVPADEMIPILLRMLDRCKEGHIDPFRIAYVIAIYSDKMAVPGLIRAFQHPDLGVRPAAVWALCRVGGDDKDVIPVLTKALEDKSTAEEAARSLKMI